MIVVLVAFIVTLGVVFVALMAMGLLLHAWPLLILLILWLIARDLLAKARRT